MTGDLRDAEQMTKNDWVLRGIMGYERGRMTDAIKTIDILPLFMMSWAFLGGKHDGVTVGELVPGRSRSRQGEHFDLMLPKTVLIFTQSIAQKL